MRFQPHRGRASIVAPGAQLTLKHITATHLLSMKQKPGEMLYPTAVFSNVSPPVRPYVMDQVISKAPPALSAWLGNQEAEETK